MTVINSFRGAAQWAEMNISGQNKISFSGIVRLG